MGVLGLAIPKAVRVSAAEGDVGRIHRSVGGFRRFAGELTVPGAPV